MDTRRIQLEADKYYHIFNRGINGQRIFLEEKNYNYFLEKYQKYVSPYFETFAYCLPRNHFHLLVKVKSEEEIREILGEKHKLKTISWITSNAFASLFKSYSQAINKGYNRTGGFFEEPFHRIEVDNSAYYKTMVSYIHRNPQKHGFVKDYKDYRHSSYYSHLSELPTKLNREEVVSWFGETEEYIKFHESNINFPNTDNRFLEL